MRVVDRPKRIGLVLRVAIGVWLMAVVIDRPVAAFQGTLRDVDTVGPWHAASAWRERKVDPTAELGSVIAAAQAELAMGNPERALAILSENPVPDSAFGGAPARIFAIALYRQEEFAKSGVLFARAAGYAGGVRRGVLLAQAAEAHQRAGRLLDAQRYYRLASLDLPEIGGWLAIREAEVTRDTAEALATLERAPDYAWRRAAGVRALLLEAAGDTAGAIAMFTAAGDLVKAARFAWESGDAALARELVYAALDDDEQAGAAADLALADPELAPLDVDDHVNLARTLRRSGEAKAAAALLESVVTTVDSSPATWFEYADMLQAAGDRWGALRAFERASESGPRAAEAEYRGARLLISLRQIARGRRALRAFAAKHPEHEHTPTAVFLLGDLDQDAGRRRTADSLFRIVAERWPQVSIASQARLRLASRALLSGDTASALLRFRAEAENGGARANASRYQIARLKLASGDSVGAYAAPSPAGLCSGAVGGALPGRAGGFCRNGPPQRHRAGSGDRGAHRLCPE
jgi:tetratricopeptide (TPR) repeat protein